MALKLALTASMKILRSSLAVPSYGAMALKRHLRNERSNLLSLAVPSYGAMALKPN